MAKRVVLVVLVVLAAVCSADDGGRRTRLALPDGVQTDYSYAANDRLMSLVTTKGAGTLASFAYTHDAVGKRNGITLANGETLAYTYDNAYRLTRELRKDSGQQTLFDQTFVYDAVGNRVSTVKDGITTTCVYSNANQLTTETTGNTVKTYAYDANGNQTLVETRVSGQLTTTEQTWYDQLSRRTQYVKTVGGTPTSESFTYRGAAWHRRTQTASAVTTTFLYDGNNVACDFIAGSLDTFYVTPFLDENLSLTRQSTTHYYTHDGLGSVRTFTNTAGTTVNTYAYTAFGEPYTPGTTITLPQRYTFTGREQNPVSDTMFYRYRPYSPSLGTMLNRNPWGYIHPNPSLYDAMNQNPVRYAEPFSSLAPYPGYPVKAVEDASRQLAEDLLGRRGVAYAKGFTIGATRAAARQAARAAQIAKGATYGLDNELVKTAEDVVGASPSTGGYRSSLFRRVQSMEFKGYTAGEMCSEMAVDAAKDVSGYSLGNRIDEAIEHGRKTNNWDKLTDVSVDLAAEMGAKAAQLSAAKKAAAAQKAAAPAAKPAAKPRGMRNPKTKAAVRKGRKVHDRLKKKVEQKPGWRPEPTLKDPKTGKRVVPDAVTPSGKPVELKPNTPTGRAKGAAQMKKYERATGKAGRVIYYDPKGDD